MNTVQVKCSTKLAPKAYKMLHTNANYEMLHNGGSKLLSQNTDNSV